MTIEEVMEIAVSYGYGPRKWTDELRAALLALVAQARDEVMNEAAACAREWEDEYVVLDTAPNHVDDAIRARIAARAEGGKHCSECVNGRCDLTKCRKDGGART